MNKGQAFGIGATLSVATVSLFFNGHHYTAGVFGLAALVFVGFGVFSRQADAVKTGARALSMTLRHRGRVN